MFFAALPPPPAQIVMPKANTQLVLADGPRHIRAGSPPPQGPRHRRSTPAAWQNLPPKPAASPLHPFGGSFVRLGYTLGQCSARAQGFFDGLLGLSTNDLESAQHNHAMAAMARRLFEIRQLSGRAGAHETYPAPQDIDKAASALAKQHLWRARGAHINQGIFGAAAWFNRWSR